MGKDWVHIRSLLSFVQRIPSPITLTSPTSLSYWLLGVSRIMPPFFKEVHTWTPGACKYVTLQGKKDLPGWTVKNLEMGDDPGWVRWKDVQVHCEIRKASYRAQRRIWFYLYLKICLTLLTYIFAPKEVWKIHSKITELFRRGCDDRFLPPFCLYAVSNHSIMSIGYLHNSKVQVQ